MTGSRGPSSQERSENKSKAAPAETGGSGGKARAALTFDDNGRLMRMIGGHDENLLVLEQRLGVEIVRRGNVVSVAGAPSSVQTARDVLHQLYARAESAAHIAVGDVEGLIRHVTSGPAAEGMAQIKTRKRIVSARTRTQSTYINALDRSDLVFGVGPAGTGKTYLAVAFAAQCLERGLVDRIILSRPAVEAGERLGFLPGDMKEKVDPYLRPLYDALYDVLPPEKVERDIASGVIEIAPLAFMRGRTLAHAFVILDEAQNTTSMQMKMFLTRLGEGSKMVVTGDPTQIDLPPGQVSGLEEAVALLHNVDGIEAIRFLAADVVRRDLVQRIVIAYEAAGAGAPRGRSPR